ncbi:MAG: SMC-Scp complex subunit ScpB, partial [Candidatus Zambryskibacteria bacterium]|nr:SMC-Scp complex subunit ScpB [Candidatus Zambryskibacteria bacterium]
MNIENKLEAILFYKNSPLGIKELAKIIEESEKTVKEALQKLSVSLQNRGICLILTDSEAALATAPEMKDFIKQIAKDEMSKDIGKAGLETLAITIYNGPVSRREIDYIRGVNSTFVIRNLCIRGLIEKELDSKDQRVYKYKSSLALLAHLGLKRPEELPNFETLKKELENSNEQQV